MGFSALAELAPSVSSSRQVFGRVILVIDDDADAREVLRDVLTFHGAEVIEAASAREARLALTRERPDLILSDIMMPDEDGLQLIASVRRAEDGRRPPIPAAAISANASAANQARALAAGFQLFIPKPYELADILLAVNRLAPAPRHADLSAG